LALRVGFFLIVAVMLLFNFAPVPTPTARFGITACVLALFAVGFLHVVLENHYVSTGRATEVDLSAQSNETKQGG
jgi:hypothetical protein